MQAIGYGRGICNLFTIFGKDAAENYCMSLIMKANMWPVVEGELASMSE
jgi:hypothetical protein